MPLRCTHIFIISGSLQPFESTRVPSIIIFCLMKNSLCCFSGSTSPGDGFSKLLFVWKGLHFTFIPEVFFPGHRVWGWWFSLSALKIMSRCLDFLLSDKKSWWSDLCSCTGNASSLSVAFKTLFLSYFQEFDFDMPCCYFLRRTVNFFGSVDLEILLN